MKQPRNGGWKSIIARGRLIKVESCCKNKVSGVCFEDVLNVQK